MDDSFDALVDFVETELDHSDTEEEVSVDP
jgi:hypothetical protein